MVRTNENLVNNEMQNYIEKLLKDLAVENYTIDISEGSILGDNYLGLIAKVVVTGEDKDGKNTTLNFIVKSAPKNEFFRTLAPIRLAYDREIYIYNQVLPVFTKFQEEVGILKPFKSFAKYYESTMSDFNEAIVMEDMKELGFNVRDRQKSLDYDHAVLALREYGKLHALSYALRDQRPELFETLSANTQDKFFATSYLSETSKMFFRENTERALKSLDPVKDEAAYNKFNRFQDNMFDLVLEAVKAESAGRYAVINHGDCWMNNILFKYQDPTNPNLPTKLCFLDWQLSRLGSPALDLSYFLFTNTDRKLREEHYDSMIQEYYNSLSSFLRDLGSQPEKMLPFEILQEHLKKFSFFGMYMSTLVLHLMSSEADEIPDVNLAQDSSDVAIFNSKNEDKYQDKMRAVILDCVKFNYDF